MFKFIRFLVCVMFCFEIESLTSVKGWNLSASGKTEGPDYPYESKQTNKVCCLLNENVEVSRFE